jgi:O-antigen ligase
LVAVCVVLLGGAILWSGSRSSIAATVAVLIVIAVIRGAPRGKGVAAVLLAMAASLCVALPFVGERSPSLFSGRGRIWHLALEAWMRRPWTGWGSDWFLREAGMRTELGARSAYTLFHAHNQFLHLLVTGGVVTALAVTIMMLIVCRAAVRLHGQEQAVAIGYLVAFFISGSLELNLGFVDRYQFWVTSLVPLVLIAVAGSARRSGARPVHRSERIGPLCAGAVIY